MSDPFGGGGGGGFGPPNQGGGGGGFGQPPGTPPGGGGFGQPPGGPPPGGGGFGPPPGGGGFGQPPQGGGGFGQPPQGGGGFGQPPGGGFGSPGMVPRPAAQINEMPAMIMGAITALFCCLPGGVIAIVLAQGAKTAAANGDQAGADSKLRTSMIISGVSMVLVLIMICLYGMLMIVANA